VRAVTAALVVFVLSYVVIAGGQIPLLRLDRPAGAMLGAVGMIVVGVVEPDEAFDKALSHDTLLLLLGTMLVTAYMAEAGLFRLASWAVLVRAGGARRLLVAVVFMAGGLSALLVNDTVCLMAAPLVVQVVLDAGLPPLPFLLALAFGSNAGSVATPTGNPQNMIIATMSHIPYARFAGALLLPAAVSLIVVAGVLLLVFGRTLPHGPLAPAKVERPAIQPKLAGLCVLVLAALVAAFLSGVRMDLAAMTAAGILVLLGRRRPRRMFEAVDWMLLLFFGGLFVVTYGVGKTGVAAAMFEPIRPWLGTHELTQAGVFGLFTVAASQVVSNVPFVLLAAHWMPSFADPTLMWLSTAMFSTLAGNLTVVGSVANIIVLEGAGEHGKIGFWRFLRVGALVTGATLAAGYAVLWAEHALGWI